MEKEHPHRNPLLRCSLRRTGGSSTAVVGPWRAISVINKCVLHVTESIKRIRIKTGYRVQDILAIATQTACLYSLLYDVIPVAMYRRLVEQKFREQKNNTRDSNVVPHRSTNRARRCLTSLSRREAVLSSWYGRSCYAWKKLISILCSIV